MDITVEIVDTSIPDGTADIVERLPPVGSITPDGRVILLFRDQHVYRTGMVLLATWRKTLPEGIEVIIDDSELREGTRRLFSNSGFRDIIERNHEQPDHTGLVHGRVPLQAVVRGYSTEQVISQICNVVENYASQLGDIKPFRTILSELCENTYAHSEFEIPGYICAHLYTQNDRFEIALADSGIGIRNSYLEGTSQEHKRRIASGACAIDLAMDGLTSSKPTTGPGTTTSHFGYGLFIVRRLIEENQGRLCIISGNECVTIERFQRRRRELGREWPGTFVGILINVGGSLPLESIYEEGILRVVPRHLVETNEEIRQPIASSPSEPPAPAEPASPIPQPEDILEVALSRYGTQLLTRELGTAIRADVATALATGRRVKVVLQDIEDITPSVADECFGKLAEAMGRERFEKKIVLAGGSPLMSRLIQLVVANRVQEDL